MRPKIGQCRPATFLVCIQARDDHYESSHGYRPGVGNTKSGQPETRKSGQIAD